MKQTKKKIVWLVAFLAVGSIPVFGKPFAVGPYLGQTPPGPIAQVFAPGLICDTRPHQWETWELLGGWQHLLFLPELVCLYHRKHRPGLDNA